MKYIVELCTGLLFGLGLIISGMSNPTKVQGFLDIAGLWDPSLMFVMGGAIGVAVLPFYWISQHRRTLLGSSISLPNNLLIDRRLIIGNALFGIGWGIAGICPGPAVVSLGSGIPEAALFIITMLIGMKTTQWFTKKMASRAGQKSEQD